MENFSISIIEGDLHNGAEDPFNMGMLKLFSCRYKYPVPPRTDPVTR